MSRLDSPQIAILALLSVTSDWVRATGSTLNVAVAGDCGGASPCYATIQGAVHDAEAEDTIKIAGGVYTDVNNYGGREQTVYVDKFLDFRGGYTVTNWVTPNPSANPTILDAVDNDREVVPLPISSTCGGCASRTATLLLSFALGLIRP